jgi:plastocyanin
MMRRRGAVDVAGTAFEPANVALSRRGSLRWRFFDDELHNVTVANGPRGFSSVNLNGGREFAYRFRRAGTYRLFCSLHPLMTSTVRVRK